MVTAKKLGQRLTLVILIGLIIITTFFVGSSYYSSKKNLQESVLNRLCAISNTIALQIDGDAHKKITDKYRKKDELTDPLKDKGAAPIFELLREAKASNQLSTDIYTLFIETEKGEPKVYMGIISADTQYFRHPYFSHPKELLSHFDKGAKLPIYMDEHGTWLSVFTPIKDSNGNTVAVIQVDEHFEVFLKKLQRIALRNILISLTIIIVIASIMFYFISGIVKVDNQKTKKIQQAYRLVDQQNKNISDSINYAQRIQQAIVASEENLRQYFPKSFMYYNAKDVVSGDFPWMMKKGDSVYVAVVDCTGHGVPGAMLSFIGYFLLNEINSHKECLSPNVILNRLHEGVVKTLKQGGNVENAHDGMDVALCKINLSTNTLEYSGAYRPLYFTRDGQLQEIKGCKKSIGGTQYKKLNRVFENAEIQLQKEDSFYFFSDGFVDQMGGESGNVKLGTKTVREMLTNLDHSNIDKVSEHLIDRFVDWKGDVEQLDDLLLIGIQV